MYRGRILIGFLTLFLFVGIFGIFQPVAVAVGVPQIVSEPAFRDFGNIYQEDGKITTNFQISNNGSVPIALYRLSTSCGCTTAKMDMADLQPGEIREMIVTYDPQVHEDQFGKIKRMVYLQNSDPEMPELTIELTANVLEPRGGIKKKAIVFYNEACQDCGELVNKEFPALFGEYGYEIEKRDYVNEKENRKLLNEFNQKWGVPFELQSHIEAFVGKNILIGGHVPEPIIRYILQNQDKFQKILVYQDDMHGTAETYKVWDFQGEIKTYPIDEPITSYLNEKKSEGFVKSVKGFWPLFTVITGSAFLDGINPCAIAVLLFFIAFLFSIKRTKRSIWKMGLVYILAIFLAYFLIGIGIAQAIIISGSPHLMAFIGSYLVIGLGIIQLIGLAFPKFPIKLRIPISARSTMEKWLHKATLPAAFIGGFVVGLCTFPCSGGIYVAIIGLLAASQTYVSGLIWMIWYNLIFISPLIIILFLAGNPLMVKRLEKLERKESKLVKLIIALTMILLGIFIILFFT